MATLSPSPSALKYRIPIDEKTPDEVVVFLVETLPAGKWYHPVHLPAGLYHWLATHMKPGTLNEGILAPSVEYLLRRGFEDRRPEVEVQGLQTCASASRFEGGFEGGDGAGAHTGDTSAGTTGAATRHSAGGACVTASRFEGGDSEGAHRRHIRASWCRCPKNRRRFDLRVGGQRGAEHMAAGGGGFPRVSEETLGFPSVSQETPGRGGVSQETLAGRTLAEATDAGVKASASSRLNWTPAAPILGVRRCRWKPTSTRRFACLPWESHFP